MGLAMSPLQLLIILVIVAVIFGTKRLRDVGGDLGSAVKSFRKAMNTTGDADDDASSRRSSSRATSKRTPSKLRPFPHLRGRVTALVAARLCSG